MKPTNNLLCLLLLICSSINAQTGVSQERMQKIYEASITPYKYGMVIVPESNDRKYDCPTVFRKGDQWLMTFVCYDGKGGTDGRGYETWLAKSDDLLHWEIQGKVLELPPSDSPAPSWDQNQRGGFPALIRQL